MTAAPQSIQPMTATASVESCSVCGGPLSSKRTIIYGRTYHERCALMSYPPHTHEDYARLSDSHASLRARVEELTKALKLLWEEAVQSGNSTANDYGWPKARAATLAALNTGEGE